MRVERVIYRVTEGCGAFGILGTNRRTGRSVVTMPFLESRDEAEELARRLEIMQAPIEVFREAWLQGALENGGINRERHS